MSKYDLMSEWELDKEVTSRANLLRVDDPLEKWEDCYKVMDQLLEITGGVLLKEDGSATTEINGKQITETGGHCRAICLLFLMAKDAQNQLQNAYRYTILNSLYLLAGFVPLTAEAQKANKLQSKE